MNANVDIKSIFISLMEKLAKFAGGANSDVDMPELDIFKLFRKYIDKIIVD